MSFTYEGPVNQTSLGQMSLGILAEFYRRQLLPNIFPIGSIDISQFSMPPGFDKWFQHCWQKSVGSFKKDEKSIKYWHIGGSHSKIGNNNNLYTVHELDQITPIEANILRQYGTVSVPCEYNKEVFAAGGIEAKVVPNFFDSRHIFPAPVHKDEDVTYWGLVGKYEKRKHTNRIIDLWCRKYGGDKKHRLNLNVFNMHLFQNVPPEQHMPQYQNMIQQNLGRALPWNVSLMGFLGHEDFNKCMNGLDIDLSGLSGAEGFNLPYFNSRCLGKRGVALAAHAHLDYVTEENSVLVQPAHKEDAKDGFFFKEGAFNQGNIYSLPQDEVVIAAFEEALGRSAPDPDISRNLQEKFSVKNTVDKLLDF